MSKTKVVMNRAAFGADVMAGSGISARIRQIAESVASRVPNGKVELITEPVRGGGSRVRARVSNGTSDADEARSNELTIALLGSVGSAAKPK